MNNFLKKFFHYTKKRISLEQDKEDVNDVIISIKEFVSFKGTNLWILILAILIASVGLNVNSTAVVIGAMLISPLMGPIMGLGLGVSIYDLSLIKKSYKNLFIATSISLLTSTIYFYFSPFPEAGSEILSRVSPTIWDVIIAFTGGTAGIIATYSKKKSNVIPGVAIATALMPPLCTAGYGLANGNMKFFFGALYLYIINSIMISLSVYLMTRFFKFPKVEFLDSKKEKNVKLIIIFVVTVTILPSIYFAYNLIQNEIFENKSKNYLKKEFNLPNSFYMIRDIYQISDSGFINIFIYGDKLADSVLNIKKNKLSEYGLNNTKLNVTYASAKFLQEIEKLKSEISGLYESNETVFNEIEIKLNRIREDSLRKALNSSEEIGKEVKIIDSNVLEFSFSDAEIYNIENLKTDTLKLIYIKFDSKPAEKDLNKIDEWLKQRLKTDSLKIITEIKNAGK